MNIFAVRKNTHSIFAYNRLGAFLYGLAACSKYDETVKSIMEDFPNDVEVCVSIYHFDTYIVCKKENGELKCKIEKNSSIENTDGVYAMFKSLDVATPVLANKMSFSEAFNQSRVTLKGDTQSGMQLVKILDIAQAYLASRCRRKKYLKFRIKDKKIARKIKFFVRMRGLV